MRSRTTSLSSRARLPRSLTCFSCSTYKQTRKTCRKRTQQTMSQRTAYEHTYYLSLPHCIKLRTTLLGIKESLTCSLCLATGLKPLTVLLICCTWYFGSWATAICCLHTISVINRGCVTSSTDCTHNHHLTALLWLSYIPTIQYTSTKVRICTGELHMP